MGLVFICSVFLTPDPDDDCYWFESLVLSHAYSLLTWHSEFPRCKLRWLTGPILVSVIFAISQKQHIYRSWRFMTHSLTPRKILLLGYIYISWHSPMFKPILIKRLFYYWLELYHQVCCINTELGDKQTDMRNEHWLVIILMNLQSDRKWQEMHCFCSVSLGGCFRHGWEGTAKILIPHTRTSLNKYQAPASVPD